MKLPDFRDGDSPSGTSQAPRLCSSKPSSSRERRSRFPLLPADVQVDLSHPVADALLARPRSFAGSAVSIPERANLDQREQLRAPGCKHAERHFSLLPSAVRSRARGRASAARTGGPISVRASVRRDGLAAPRPRFVRSDDPAPPRWRALHRKNAPSSVRRESERDISRAAHEPAGFLRPQSDRAHETRAISSPSSVRRRAKATAGEPSHHVVAPRRDEHATTRLQVLNTSAARAGREARARANESSGGSRPPRHEAQCSATRGEQSRRRRLRHEVDLDLVYEAQPHDDVDHRDAVEPE